MLRPRFVSFAALPLAAMACAEQEGNDGNYRDYATDEFPYLMGCYRGTPTRNR